MMEYRAVARVGFSKHSPRKTDNTVALVQQVLVKVKSFNCCIGKLHLL